MKFYLLVLAAALLVVAVLAVTCDPEPATTRALRGLP